MKTKLSIEERMSFVRLGIFETSGIPFVESLEKGYFEIKYAPYSSPPFTIWQTDKGTTWLKQIGVIIDIEESMFPIPIKLGKRESQTEQQTRLEAELNKLEDEIKKLGWDDSGFKEKLNFK
jgi:hypothetical protein